MDNLSRFVGSKIRKYRTSKGMTQKELGERLGVQGNTVSAYETGRISPEQDILFAISDVLDVSINDLFPERKGTSNELERALKMTSGLQAKDVDVLNQIIEKSLSLDGEERERFIESLKFTVEYFKKTNS